MPTDTGTRDTASANQPNTADQPKHRTTATAEGNGQEPREPAPNMRQSYEKKTTRSKKKRKKNTRKTQKTNKKGKGSHRRKRRTKPAQKKPTTDHERAAQHTPYI
jgi:hypothetical protein